MKKIAMMLLLFLIVGQAYGLCYTATVDNVLSEKSKSELHPVQDAAKIASVANNGVNKTMEVKPIAKLMEPIRTVRKETVKGAYSVTNMLWDTLTLRSFREKKK